MSVHLSFLTLENQAELDKYMFKWKLILEANPHVMSVRPSILPFQYQVKQIFTAGRVNPWRLLSCNGYYRPVCRTGQWIVNNRCLEHINFQIIWLMTSWQWNPAPPWKWTSRWTGARPTSTAWWSPTWRWRTPSTRRKFSFSTGKWYLIWLLLYTSNTLGSVHM